MKVYHCEKAQPKGSGLCGPWDEQPNYAGFAMMYNCLYWSVQSRKGKILVFTKMSKFANREHAILKLHFLGEKNKQTPCLAYIKCNIAITQTDNSAMTTVLMFYRQTPRHSNFEGRVIPAESQSESEKWKKVLETTKHMLSLVC